MTDTDDRIPNEPIMKYFAYNHLPAELREVSSKFASLAWSVHDSLPRCAERSVALRKHLRRRTRQLGLRSHRSNALRMTCPGAKRNA